MADQESRFVVSLDGDGSPLRAVFAKAKRDISSDVAEIERITGNVEVFKGLKDSLDKASGTLDKAKTDLARLRDLEREVQAAGENIGKDLAAGITAAAKAVAAAERDFNKQTAAVDKMRASLQAAGVNTKALGTEQIRLAAALRQAEAAEADRQARQTLGIKSTRELNAELAKEAAALQQVRTSSASSALDISNAQKAYLEREREIAAQLRGNAANADKAGVAIRTAFLGAVAPIALVTAGIAAVVEGFRTSVENAKEWRLEIAKISTVTNGSQADIDELDKGVRRLAQSMGFDAVEGAKALYDILRSGVSRENALSVLATSADVAKASLTEIGTAAKLSTTLIKAYGVEAKDLAGVLDVLFQAQKDGGATIAELANGIGELLPVARAANVPIAEIAAAIRTMVQAGLDAPSAITALQRVIVKLGSPEVIKNLQGIGIEVNGLAGTLAQIGERNLSLDRLLGLEVGNEKSLKGLVALTRGYADLNGELGRLQSAAGAAARESAKLDKTPQEAQERWAAATKELTRNLGDQYASTAFLKPALTDLAVRYNNLVEENKALRQEFGLTNSAFPTSFSDLGKTLEIAGIQMGLFRSETHETAMALQAAKTAATESATALGASLGTMLATVQAQAASARQTIDNTSAALRNFADDLAKQRDASQKAATQAIADINARAAAEIAAIDKSRLSETQAAAAALEVQTKAAADRLAIIVQNGVDVVKAVEAEAAARRAVAGKSAEEQKQVEQQIAQARIAALAPIKAALEAHYAEYLKLAQASADKLKAIEEERVRVNASIEDQIRAIRREGLTAYQAYQDQVRQIDELTSKARAELAKGDSANLKAVEDLANRARSLAGSIGKEVSDGSEVVVTAYSAQQEAVGKLGEVQRILNDVLDRRKTAEKEAGEAAADAAAKAKLALDDYRKEYDALVAKVGEGISLKINADASDVKAGIAKLQDAVEKEKVLAKVELDLKNARAALAELTEKIKSGATEGAAEIEAKIIGALEAAAAKAPALQVDVSNAVEQVDNLGTKILDLAALQPTVTATIESNVGEVQAAIDQLKQPTSSTHTIYIQRVEVNATGGLVGSTLRKGGAFMPMAAAAQRFAGGGHVFRRPAWRKVPGVGDQDTVPAALPTGAFVVRKAASQFYGDGLLSRLAAGGPVVQRFAGGGSVSAPGGIASRILVGAGGKGALGGLSTEYRETLDDLFTIKERAQNLAHSATGLDIGEWAARILNKFDSFDDTRKKKIAQIVKESFDGFLQTIEVGRRAGVPVVMDAGMAALAFRLGGRMPGFAPAGTDTVAAMLTPGEWVIRPPSVGYYGAGLMDAINRMALPRSTLAAMLDRPTTVARFAGGGPVGASSIDFNPGATMSAPGASVDRAIYTVNLNASASDLFSVDNVRRFLIPVLDEIDRRRAKA